MVTEAYKILAGQGYTSAYVCPIITGSGTPATQNYSVPIPQADVDKYIYFNVLNVVNNSLASDLIVYLDGNTDRAIKVLAGFDKTINGSRFRSVVIHNNTATDTVAGDVYVTVQKELDQRDYTELRLQGAV